MAIRVDIDAADTDRLAAGLKRLTVQDLLESVRPQVFKRMNTAKNAIRANLSGSVLNRRSGALAASVDTEGPTVQSGTLLGRLGVIKGPALPYADIFLKRSAAARTIRPKTAKKLAIPLPAALTASGIARYASPLRQTLAAAFPDGTFVAKNILFGKIGPKEIVPLFVFKDSVTMPHRDYMQAPIEQLLGRVVRDVADAVAVKVVK